MRHLTYAALLIACLLVTLPLEWVLGARVYRQWRRAVLAFVPTAIAFVIWDLIAVHLGWWSFDRRFITGLRIGLPVEEIAFFVVVPVCSLLTFEAVRRIRPGWIAGDEAGER